MTEPLRVAVAQIAPVFLDRVRTTEKIIHQLRDAADHQCGLVVFGETILPAYPCWLSRTDGARFESLLQKELHACYLEQSVSIENGDLDAICEVAAERRLAVILGVAERPADRGGHSIFCSRVFIDANGIIQSVHRKLMPTYEERLAWAAGDGAGLVTHPVGSFTVGALNCWENWMPLARSALYAAGENLHVMLWPGDLRLTEQITRFVALEARSFVISVSGLLRCEDVPQTVPHREAMCRPHECLFNGGSCVAGPDGNWIVEPVTDREALIVVELDLAAVHRERQNFDPAGHYGRPDVLQLTVRRRRQAAARFLDDDGANPGNV